MATNTANRKSPCVLGFGVIDDFIRENLRLGPAPGVPEVHLYMAHPASGLRRLGYETPPYWAYPWAGGAVLARHVLEVPASVAGKHVLDLGAGGGIVGIAAMLAGARGVLASEIDPNGVAALKLNASANGVNIATAEGDLLDGPPPEVDLILVGDLFYDAKLAKRVTAFLDRCVAIDILVGDIGRKPLPVSRLRRIAEYPVPDFGETAATKRSGVYVFS